MHSLYPLFLLWLLLSCTFATPIISKEKGLRYDGDIYTVERLGFTYNIYTPYYTQNSRKVPVTKL
ncbi:hypothetical protein LZ30DRAFT_554963, partial [Colletotrichum cereale]